MRGTPRCRSSTSTLPSPVRVSHVEVPSSTGEQACAPGSTTWHLIQPLWHNPTTTHSPYKTHSPSKLRKRQGRQGAEAAFVSSHTTVPLLPRKDKFPRLLSVAEQAAHLPTQWMEDLSTHVHLELPTSILVQHLWPRSHSIFWEPSLGAPVQYQHPFPSPCHPRRPACHGHERRRLTLSHPKPRGSGTFHSDSAHGFSGTGAQNRGSDHTWC